MEYMEGKVPGARYLVSKYKVSITFFARKSEPIMAVFL